jgi:hypothetical protein
MMKQYFIVCISLFLLSCDQKPTATQSRLESKWSEDGESLTIVRNGIEVASFRDSSNAFFVELNGMDGYPDAQLSYYDDTKNSQGAESKSIALAWIQRDGSTKVVLYDNDGNLILNDEAPPSE